MQLEDLPEEILDLICQYTGMYNFNLSKTCTLFARVANKYNLSSEEYKISLFGEGNLGLICRYNLLLEDKFIEQAVINKQLHVLAWAISKGISLKDMAYIAAREGQMKVLKWLRKNNCLLDETVCANAALNGHLNVLIWARKNYCFWGERVCANAALNGHLDVLIWAKGNYCLWDEKVCANAALNGHLDVLIWARNNNCPWDETVCSNAALNGHLDVLIWARNNNCSWDERVCSNAALNGHLDVLIWARNNNCPWDEMLFLHVTQKSTELIDWLKNNNYPWDWNSFILSKLTIFIEEVLLTVDSLSNLSVL